MRGTEKLNLQLGKWECAHLQCHSPENVLPGPRLQNQAIRSVNCFLGFTLKFERSLVTLIKFVELIYF